MRSRWLQGVLGHLLGGCALGATVAATGAEPGATVDELPAVVISAAALNEDARELAATYSLLKGAELERAMSATLGDTLGGLVGVRADSFGGGAARPVIRGQGAPRVKVLSDSASLLDASEISPDHAVTTEPMLVERIEVLRGPATLLYGSGAIGGVVNVLDRRIPEVLPDERLSGRFGLRGATVADERALALQATTRLGNHLALHGEGAFRKADEYRVPRRPARVHGSFAESANLAAGISWVADRGFVGLAYSYRDDDYGLPGHRHEYDGCHPHDGVLHCDDHGHDEQAHAHAAEHHDGAPVIDLASRRVDLRGEMRDPLAGIERIRVRASYTDYRHHELEDEQVSTSFFNRGAEARIEVLHRPQHGWRGVAGLQHADTGFRSLGEEAFIPRTRSRNTGVFLVEHYELSDAWHFELGARREWRRHQPVDDPHGRPRFGGSATSFSAAAIWEMVPGYHLTLSLARAQRLPHAQELYARGPHLATNTYECGLVSSAFTCGDAADDVPLRKETSRNVSLSLRRSAGPVTFEFGGYYNQADHYIHARTLDQFGDYRLIRYTQRDARFRGIEGELTWQVTGQLAATVFGDAVRATLDAGGNLPRIPAARYGTRLQARFGALDTELEYSHVATQTRVAAYETRTPGYDMLNLTLTREAGERLRLHVRGSNLLDELARNHVSFLADAAPLRGRSLDVGLTLSF